MITRKEYVIHMHGQTNRQTLLLAELTLLILASPNTLGNAADTGASPANIARASTPPPHTKEPSLSFLDALDADAIDPSGRVERRPLRGPMKPQVEGVGAVEIHTISSSGTVEGSQRSLPPGYWVGLCHGKVGYC